MIEQQGRVIAVDGSVAQVQIGGRSGCPACDAGEGCGAGIFGRLLNRSEARLSLANELNLQPGDPVLVGLPETTLLRLVMRLYGWPLLAALGAGALAFALCQLMGVTDLSAASTGGESPMKGAIVDAAVLAAGLLAGGLVLRAVHRSAAAVFTPRSLVMLESASRLDCRPFDRIA